MEDLVIKHKVHTAFRKGLGIFTIRLDFMEIDQMKQVREYFLRLAGEKGLSHENRYRK